MKTKLISKILLSLGLVFVLGSAITQVHGDIPGIPVVTIYSTGDVVPGKTSSFVLKMNPPLMFGGTYVNFSVSGTAIPGVDYVPLVSPAYIGPSGYGTLLVQPLPNRRGSSISQAFSVGVTLEPGPGYGLGEPSVAKMVIQPSNVQLCCQ